MAAGVDAARRIPSSGRPGASTATGRRNVALATAKASRPQPARAGRRARGPAERRPAAHVAGSRSPGPGSSTSGCTTRWLHDVLREVVAAGVDGYARPDLGQRRSGSTSSSSAPTPPGPLHAGDGRWAAYGDALCRPPRACGYAVHREYYLNDRGVQMQLFAESLAARASAATSRPRTATRASTSPSGPRRCPTTPTRSSGATSGCKRDMRETLERIGVRLRHLVQRAVDGRRRAPSRPRSPTCARRGVVYEADGAVWLRTTDFGDDKDRVLVKSDGEPTYLLPDIAYHRDKFARGLRPAHRRLGRRPPRLRAAAQGRRAGARPRPRRARDRPRPAGHAHARRRGGAHVASAAGDIVELAEVLDEVGPDVARLTFLLQSIDTRQTVRPRPGHEPVDGQPGLLRAVRPRPHRLDRARRPPSAASSACPLADVDLVAARPRARARPAALAVASCPTWCSTPCSDRAPHKVTTWVRELAGRFHGFYHDCYVMGEGVSARADPGPAVAGRGGARSGWPSASTCSACSAPESM